MQLGVVGLGRMGANIARRLMRAGHACAVHDRTSEPVDVLCAEGASGARTLDALAGALPAPRIVWIMLPAAAVDATIAALVPRLAAGDIVIDGGNSHYRDDVRRARELAARGLRYVDVGTSGGVWGLESGYCLTIGGDAATVRALEPIFEALAPGVAAAPPTRARKPGGSAERGWLHCGPAGAGHLVKMVHNGIEYGIMAAYAEGLNLLKHVSEGTWTPESDRQTAPLAEAKNERFAIDVAEVAEVWRRGSVIRSWLLDLTADALAKDPQLAGLQGVVSDSGEGRWTVQTAVDAAVPAPVLSAALFARFASRGEDDFANRLLSAMRREFGGHVEEK